MVVAAEVRRLVKPLLERHDDLVMVGRTIHIKPVRHFLRAVIIDRTSRADWIRPIWYTFPLFSVAPYCHLSFGAWIYAKSFRGWSTAHAGISEELVRSIEVDALPNLRSIETFEDFLRIVAGTNGRHHMSDDPVTRVAVDVAMGTREGIERCCARISTYGVPESYEPDIVKEKIANAQELCRRATDGDMSGAIALLHTWEAAAAKREKIEKYWQPSPFPVEQQS